MGGGLPKEAHEEYEWDLQFLKIKDGKNNSHKIYSSIEFRKMISEGKDKILLELIKTNKQLFRSFPPINNKDRF